MVLWGGGYYGADNPSLWRRKNLNLIRVVADFRASEKEDSWGWRTADRADFFVRTTHQMLEKFGHFRMFSVL